MKKSILITLLCFVFSFRAFAQNYQCLQTGVKHYFTNTLNYLRGIRVDSVNTTTDSTIYYPFHTIRMSFTPLADTLYTPGSWLGSRVTQLPDGTTSLYNEWNNNETIKVHASIGDSWTFYHDSTTRYYIASVISIDTMTVSGIIDSVKTMLINAYDTSGIITTDPVNGFEIKLSKEHGFVQIFDLFTFPFHNASNTYVSGTDYYYEICGPQIFNLIDFYNPTLLDIYNFTPGDVYEYRFENDSHYSYTALGYYIDSIISRTVISDTEVNYTFKRTTSNLTSSTITDTTISINVISALLFDTALMPEEAGLGSLYHYAPNNDPLCYKSNYYSIASGTLFNTFEPCGTENAYKIGLGNTENAMCIDPDGTGSLANLVYFKKHDTICGSYHPLNVTDIHRSVSAVTISPNPATNQLTIKASKKINNMVIYTAQGKVILNEKYNSEEIKIDISSLPASLYFVRINGLEIDKFIKE